MLSELFLTLRLSRLFDTAYPLVSLLVGAVMVGRAGDWDLFLVILIIVLLNSVAMIWNDIEDRQIDADNGRPKLALLNVDAIQKLKVCIVLLVGVSLFFAWLVGYMAIILTVVTILTMWMYNSKPVQASRRPLLSIVILSGAGAFLPYLFGLSLSGIGGRVLLIGVFWWLARMSLSVLKDYKDVLGDARHSKKTFLLRYGSRRVAMVSVATLAAGYLGFILLAWPSASAPWATPALVVGAVVCGLMRHTLFSAKATYGQLDAAFRKIAQYQLLLDVGVVLWLV